MMHTSGDGLWMMASMYVVPLLVVAGGFLLVAALRPRADDQVVVPAPAFRVRAVPSGSAPPTTPAPADPRLEGLTQDERALYDAVQGAGGRILQRDLVRALPYSPATVSRILRRLERQGVLVKEPHGMTNRVRLPPLGRET